MTLPRSRVAQPVPANLQHVEALNVVDINGHGEDGSAVPTARSVDQQFRPTLRTTDQHRTRGQ
ncbi:MAG: hypothetical protein KC481_11520, partial [Acidimicrobiaceae bacterium]|nr:hypothetical protein [Acidimicrobiaceae bacterium]